MLRRSSSSVPLEQDASGIRELLDKLQTRIKDVGEEHRQTLQDIHRMTDRALTQAQSELEDNSIAQNDGVLVQTFIPIITRILGQTVEYVENHILALSAQNRRRRTSVLQIGRRRTKDELTQVLMMLRNDLEGIYSIAMPPTPSSTSGDRTDNALDIAARIGGTLSILSDSIPVLGPLKLVGAALSEVCSTVQMLRSNHKLAAEIMHEIRDYFRMVVRKVQKYPGAQADEELRKDVEELLNNLLCVQKILLELKRKKRHAGTRVFFAQKDEDSLNALQNQVRESRRMFEASLHLSTNLRVNEVAIGVYALSAGVNSLIARFESFESPARLDLARQQAGMGALLALPSPNSQIGTIDQRDLSTALIPAAEPVRAQLNSSKEQWVSVRIDLDTASHIKRHSAVSLVGVFFFLK